jgi:beta-lactamase superfamily II metal-dependent hydrolase/transcriptional regulator with XRE-family HTH domain
METRTILKQLRENHHLTQDQMAERLMVTRQAVSRWENGETQPNTDTLRMLSREFNVSINTLLGSPRKLICQCCGMPLEDAFIGRNKDGSLNEDYCQWCYADGTYTYSDMDDLIRVCVPNMVKQGFTEDQARSYMKQMLPTLDYWKRYEDLSDGGQFEAFKKQLIEEINALILTHFDKDHAGGADAVIENLKVDYVYTTWRSKESDETEEFDEALSAAGIKANVIKGTQTFTIGGAKFEIYGASESYEKDESNNSSLIIRVSFGKKSYLFMGDAQDERITEFLNSYETEADFIKIPYHGHMQDTLAQLIEAVSPESAVITNSKAEPEAEEIAETEALLLENGVTFHETADGTVTMICTADSFRISQ